MLNVLNRERKEKKAVKQEETGLVDVTACVSSALARQLGS